MGRTKPAPAAKSAWRTAGAWGSIRLHAGRLRVVRHDHIGGSARGHPGLPRHLSPVFTALLCHLPALCGRPSRPSLPAGRNRDRLPEGRRHPRDPGSPAGRPASSVQTGARRAAHVPEGSAAVPLSHRRCGAGCRGIVGSGPAHGAGTRRGLPDGRGAPHPSHPSGAPAPSRRGRRTPACRYGRVAFGRLGRGPAGLIAGAHKGWWRRRSPAILQGDDGCPCQPAAA